MRRMRKPSHLSVLFFWVHLLVILVVTKPTFATTRMHSQQKHKPAAQYFTKAIIDHFAPSNTQDDANYWTQRYYVTRQHFGGPGSPIFLLLGGEGATDRGFLYPLITDHYAVQLQAAVVQPEHRFYGQSQPMDNEDRYHDMPRRAKLLTYEQAIYDAIRLVTTLQREWGCSPSAYCPVITVGGSYPGFLAAMARLVRPDVVDMAYAASAPMKFYAQQVPQHAYYTHIAEVANAIVPGCAGAVRETLGAVPQAVSTHVAASQIGVCEGTLPDYLKDASIEYFWEEVFMMVAYTFANHNMGFYPPTSDSALARSCNTFLNATELDAVARLKKFLVDSLPPGGDCFAMTAQVPAGPNATISGGDWSGVGAGVSGDSWDFQTCTLCVEAIGLVDTMFPYRPWSIDWLTQHCQRRFGVTPSPLAINERWGIHDLAHNSNASRIIFTNGLNDGWSVSGIQHNLSDTLVAINFPNGAHHSDLSGKGPSDLDTPDIVEGFQTVLTILKRWLDDVVGVANGSDAARNVREY